MPLEQPEPPHRRVGFTLLFALAGAPVPAEFCWAVHELRKKRIVPPVSWPRQSPSSEAPNVGVFTKLGSQLVNTDPQFRVVPEAHDPLRHVDQASALWAEDVLAGYTHGPLESRVVRTILEHGAGIQTVRTVAGATLRTIAQWLITCGLNALLVSLMPEHVRMVCGHANIAMMAALIEAMYWPDWQLPELFVKGFPIAGGPDDQGGGVLDSGLFSRLTRESSFSLTDLARGAARRGGQLLPANQPWFDKVETKLRGDAKKAASDPKKREALDRAAGLCEAEATADRPTMFPAMTFQQLKTWAKSIVGSLQHVRLTRRFAVPQGLKEDGSVKYRGIDDSKDNGINAATPTAETVKHPSFMWPIIMARLFWQIAAAMCMACPELSIGLDDLRGAYRMVPNSQPWLTVVAVWSFLRNRPMFYVCPSHTFGMVSSVPNFNRLPHLVCAVAMVFLAVLVDHYVDDYMNVDTAVAGQSAQVALQLAHEIMGFTLEARKRKPNAPTHVALGVQIELGKVHTDGTATARSTDKRIRSIRQSMAWAKEANCLSASQAGKMRGKLGWVLQPVFGRVARAAMQPLVFRQFNDSSREWTPALERARLFLDVVLPKLPPLVVNMREVWERPVLVYTDASYVTSKGRPHAVLGIYIVMPDGRHFVSTLVLPLWFYRFLRPDQKTYIMQAELVASIAVYYTCDGSVPNLPDLSGRAILHFIDNGGSLAAIVNGYAAQPDNAALVDAFHLQLMSLRCRVAAHWVPSLANIGDWPTREDKMHLIPAKAVWFVMKLPPMEALDAPLAAWASSL